MAAVTGSDSFCPEIASFRLPLAPLGYCVVRASTVNIPGMNIRATVLTLTALVAVGISATAVGRPTISADPPNPAPGEPFILKLNGQRSDSCAPTLDRVENTGGEILILAHRETKACVKAPTRWQINLDQIDLKLESEHRNSVIPIKFLVSEGDGETRVAHLKAFDLLVFGHSDIRPESGLWWGEQGGQFDTGGPGTGYSIELQDDRLLMMANVYESDGDPVWLFASGSLGEGVVRADLLTLYGGQRLFGDYQAPEAALDSGQVLIHFDSPATATVWLVAPDGDQADASLALQSLSLVRYAFGLGAMNKLLAGRWLMVTGSTRQATELDLSVTSAKAGYQRAFDDGSKGLRLDCQGLAGRAHSPPTSCQLSTRDGTVAAELDRIGLNRIDGWTAEGDPITLIRWDR
jgi:hypothetical protein